MDTPALDRPISALTAEELLARIAAVHRDFTESRDIAVSAARITVDKAITLGELFEEAATRFAGNYEEWLEHHFPAISKTTAWRFRQCWSQRSVLQTDEPELARLKDAYVRLGLLPPPSAEHPAGADRQPSLYTFRLVVSADKPLDTWSPLDLREFLDQTSKIEELRTRAKALLEQAA